MPKTKRSAISATIDPEVAAWLAAEADKRMVSPSFLVEKALRNLQTVVPDPDGALEAPAAQP